jgi:hypothetical protein
MSANPAVIKTPKGHTILRKLGADDKICQTAHASGFAAY